MRNSKKIGILLILASLYSCQDRPNPHLKAPTNYGQVETSSPSNSDTKTTSSEENLVSSNEAQAESNDSSTDQLNEVTAEKKVIDLDSNNTFTSLNSVLENNDISNLSIPKSVNKDQLATDIAQLKVLNILKAKNPNIKAVILEKTNATNENESPYTLKSFTIEKIVQAGDIVGKTQVVKEGLDLASCGGNQKGASKEDFSNLLTDIASESLDIEDSEGMGIYEHGLQVKDSKKNIEKTVAYSIQKILLKNKKKTITSEKEIKSLFKSLGLKSPSFMISSKEFYRHLGKTSQKQQGFIIRDFPITEAKVITTKVMSVSDTAKFLVDKVL